MTIRTRHWWSWRSRWLSVTPSGILLNCGARKAASRMFSSKKALTSLFSLRTSNRPGRRKQCHLRFGRLRQDRKWAQVAKFRPRVQQRRRSPTECALHEGPKEMSCLRPNTPWGHKARSWQQCRPTSLAAIPQVRRNRRHGYAHAYREGTGQPVSGSRGIGSAAAWVSRSRAGRIGRVADWLGRLLSRRRALVLLRMLTKGSESRQVLTYLLQTAVCANVVETLFAKKLVSIFALRSASYRRRFKRRLDERWPLREALRRKADLVAH